MVRVAILTASDKGAKGERQDISGKIIKEKILEQGWEIVDYTILPDEQDQIMNQFCKWSDEGGVDLILTTGGTGFSDRDCMPEATLQVVDKIVPGIPEIMRYYSFKITSRAMLSRAAAGIRKHTLIVNLPGSPKGVAENLEVIITSLEHGIEILKGTAKECAMKK